MCLSQLLYVSVGTSQVSRTQFPYMGQHSSRMFFPHAFARQTPTLPQNPARPPPPGSVPRPPALSPPWSGVLPPSTPAESAALPSSQCILGVSLCLCLLTEEEFLGSSKHGCSVVPQDIQSQNQTIKIRKINLRIYKVYKGKYFSLLFPFQVPTIFLHSP